MEKYEEKQKLIVWEFRSTTVVIESGFMIDNVLTFPVRGRIVKSTNETRINVTKDERFVTQCFFIPKEVDLKIENVELLRYDSEDTDNKTICLFHHQLDDIIVAEINGESCVYSICNTVNIVEFSNFLSKHGITCVKAVMRYK